MNSADAPKTTFMTDMNNYYYEVMHFGLKIPGATYQRLMDCIRRNIEVNVDNMLVNTQE